MDQLHPQPQPPIPTCVAHLGIDEGFEPRFAEGEGVGEFTNLDTYRRIMPSRFEVRRIMTEVGVTPTDDLVEHILSEVNFYQYSADGDSVSETSLRERYDDLKRIVCARLEFQGLLDGPGDCPICRRNGWIATDKHAKCVEEIYRRAAHKCGCGKPAATIRYYEPHCEKCNDQQAHLDALYD